VSYELNFWKQNPGVRLDSQETYERLSNGDLPIEQMMEKVRQAFSEGWTQFFRVDCGRMTGEEMNVFIDIGIEFGCPLYDPQTGQRFEG
jgi:hypothetical protein